MLSGALKTFLDNVFLPFLLTWVGTAVPLFGVILQIPFLGGIVKNGIQAMMDKMYNTGVITLKTNLIGMLSDEAVTQYAPEIAILQEAQALQTLTPEQDAQFNQRLQDAVKNRPGVVNG
jgi:hypothetical protein